MVARRKWHVLLVFTAVVGAAAAWTIRQPKVYSAQASVIIDSTAPRFLDNDIKDVSSDTSGNYWASREYYSTQHKVIQSRAVSQRVVEKLGLQNDAAFLGVDRISDEKKRHDIMARIDAADVLTSKIRVDPVKDSRVTLILIDDLDPNRAALLANEVADAYIQENLALKLRVTENASQWLDERRETLEKSAKTSELSLFNFKRQQDMLTTSLEDRQSMVSQRLSATNIALTDVRLAVAGLKARVDAIRRVQKATNGNDPMWADGLPGVPEKSFVTDLKMRFVSQRTECAELKERYLESHPKLGACNEKLAQIQKDLIRELGALVIAAEAELDQAQGKERNLLALLNETKAEAFEINKKQIEYDQLKREVDQNQRLFDLVLKRLKDIELSGLLRVSNVRVLDAARPVFTPIKPNVVNTMLMALAFGLLGGIAFAFALDFLDATVKNQAEIVERLGIPFLGFLPNIPLTEQVAGKDMHIFRKPQSMIAECTRAIRTNLLFMSPDKPFRSMLVTSSGPQEGKSTSVINLGITMAQSGQRVLIVDTDMRRPRLHKAFGVPNDSGVSSVLVGEGTLEVAIKSTEVPGLFVLPCGPIPPNPAELLHTNAFHDLFNKLLERYDRVILDSPPVGAVADAVVLATQVDGVVVVVKSNHTHREVARRTVQALRDVNARIFGAVLNDVNLERSAYGDYYYAYGNTYYSYGEQHKNEA